MNNQRGQIIAVYRCIISNEIIEQAMEVMDDVPAEAIDCTLHNNGEHAAELVNVVMRTSPEGQVGGLPERRVV